MYAGQIIQQGAIGRVIQVIGLGPHRLNAASRPAWFWEPEKYGGILVVLVDLKELLIGNEAVSLQAVRDRVAVKKKEAK